MDAMKKAIPGIGFLCIVIVLGTLYDIRQSPESHKPTLEIDSRLQLEKMRSELLQLEARWKAEENQRELQQLALWSSLTFEERLECAKHMGISDYDAGSTIPSFSVPPGSKLEAYMKSYAEGLAEAKRRDGK